MRDNARIQSGIQGGGQMPRLMQQSPTCMRQQGDDGTPSRRVCESLSRLGVELQLKRTLPISLQSQVKPVARQQLPAVIRPR